MSLKDKLELGLKPDAPFRPDNLPEFQKDDPACQTAAEPGEAPRQLRARDLCTTPVQVARPPRRGKRKVASPTARPKPKRRR